MRMNTVEVVNLRKSFGSLRAVNDVSFEVRQGEILGVLGPNGAGKTTLLELITQRLPKDAGDIQIFEKPIQGNPSALHNIGVCSQDLQLWPLLTCEEQLHFIGKINGMENKKAQKRTAALLERVGLQEKKKTLAQKLSGGMKRRLHLIMSMVHDPDLLIMDEPEAGLDPQSRMLVREFIKSLTPAKTIILTTHNMDEAERLSDRVAIMDKGSILELDTPDALKRKLVPEDTLDIVFDKKINAPWGLDNEKYNIQVKDKILTVVGENLISLVPEILDKILTQMGNPILFDFRRSSLEDAFIKLTGRRLRE